MFLRLCTAAVAAIYDGEQTRTAFYAKKSE